MTIVDHTVYDSNTIRYVKIKMHPELIHEVKVVCDWAAASDWCKKHVGEFNRDWYKLGIDPAATVFGDHATTWYFRDRAMANWFILTWG